MAGRYQTKWRVINLVLVFSKWTPFWPLEYQSIYQGSIWELIYYNKLRVKQTALMRVWSCGLADIRVKVVIFWQSLLMLNQVLVLRLGIINSRSVKILRMQAIRDYIIPSKDLYTGQMMS